MTTHHLNPKRDGGDNRRENLVGLHRICHNLVDNPPPHLRAVVLRRIPRTRRALESAYKGGRMPLAELLCRVA